MLTRWIFSAVLFGSALVWTWPAQAELMTWTPKGDQCNSAAECKSRWSYSDPSCWPGAVFCPDSNAPDDTTVTDKP